MRQMALERVLFNKVVGFGCGSDAVEQMAVKI